MTQEDKELLLKDLCARLPYKTIIKPKKQDDDYGRIWFIGDISAEYKRIKISYWQKKDCGLSSGMAFYNLEDIVPYLRPMSSMTDEEWEDFNNYRGVDGILKPLSNDIDWLNKHHFDYRGLIEKGLALEAPKGMYEY